MSCSAVKMKQTVAFLKIRTKWLGESLWFQGKSSEGSGNLGQSFSFLSGKGEGHTSELQLVVTCCSYRPAWHKAGSAAGSCGGEEEQLFRHHILLKQLHCTFFARRKMGRKPPLAALATAHMQNWSCLGETVGKLGICSKRFGEFKIKFQVE